MLAFEVEMKHSVELRGLGLGLNEGVKPIDVTVSIPAHLRPPHAAAINTTYPFLNAIPIGEVDENALVVVLPAVPARLHGRPLHGRVHMTKRRLEPLIEEPILLPPPPDAVWPPIGFIKLRRGRSNDAPGGL